MSWANFELNRTPWLIVIGAGLTSGRIADGGVGLSGAGPCPVVGLLDREHEQPRPLGESCMLLLDGLDALFGIHNDGCLTWASRTVYPVCNTALVFFCRESEQTNHTIIALFLPPTTAIFYDDVHFNEAGSARSARAHRGVHRCENKLILIYRVSPRPMGCDKLCACLHSAAIV